MLKNLIKYEFKATGRMLGILYAALIVLSVVTRIFFELHQQGNFNTFSGLTAVIVVFLYGMMICAVLVVTFVMILLRFYRNLLQNEGYLMNMLPVKSWQHIAAKLLVAVVWTFVSVLVVILSIAIIAAMGIPVDVWSQMWQEIKTGFGQIGLDGTYILIMTILLMITSTAAEVLQLYAAMAIGQTQNRYKILSSFAVFVGISIVFQIITTLIMWITGYWLDSSSIAMVTNTMIAGAVNVGITITVLYSLAKCVILFFTTNYFLKNKLNLE